MSTDQPFKDAITQWAREATPARDIAGAALAYHRRLVVRRRLIGSGTVLAAAAAIVIPLALLSPSWPSSSPAMTPGAPRTTAAPTAPTTQRPTTPWVPLRLGQPHPDQTGVLADTAHAPPIHMVAAGRIAVSAYVNANTGVWSLLNTTTRTYERTSWSDVDVSPGLTLAAAVTGAEGSKVLSIVDMGTHQVVRTLTFSQPVLAPKWSPDGRSLVVTTIGHLDTINGAPFDGTPYRSGFIVIDMTTGVRTMVPLVDTFGDDGEYALGTAWYRDGKLLYVPVYSDMGAALFFTPQGRPVSPPTSSTDTSVLRARISPNGKLSTATLRVDLPTQEALDFASNTSIIARQCQQAKCPHEFVNRLVVAGLDGGHAVPLTGYTSGNDDDSSQWVPLLTLR